MSFDDPEPRYLGESKPPGLSFEQSGDWNRKMAELHSQEARRNALEQELEWRHRAVRRQPAQEGCVGWVIGVAFEWLIGPFLATFLALPTVAQFVGDRARYLRPVVELLFPDRWVAQQPGGGEPFGVFYIVLAPFTLVTIAMILCRAWVRRTCVRGLMDEGTATLLLTACSATLAVAAIVGVSVAGVSGGIARGADIAIARDGVDGLGIHGWWPWTVTSVVTAFWVVMMTGRQLKKLDRQARRHAS